ncbi:hypothetical protein JCM24511_01209 [Saitozyma sp. JCM 24511]|nr:hypothetical protein JCM24511_01209 [Saitozyma sp. JCM 24511]
MYRRGVLSRWLGNTDQNKVHQEEEERRMRWESGGEGEDVEAGETRREVESRLGDGADGGDGGEGRTMREAKEV